MKILYFWIIFKSKFQKQFYKNGVRVLWVNRWQTEEHGRSLQEHRRNLAVFWKMARIQPSSGRWRNFRPYPDLSQNYNVSFCFRNQNNPCNTSCTEPTKTTTNTDSTVKSDQNRKKPVTNSGENRYSSKPNQFHSSKYQQEAYRTNNPLHQV